MRLRAPQMRTIFASTLTCGEESVDICARSRPDAMTSQTTRLIPSRSPLELYGPKFHRDVAFIVGEARTGVANLRFSKRWPANDAPPLWT
jgi:hypothetical protein